MQDRLPPPTSLDLDDQVRLVAAARLARVRSQVAVVRAISDQVERLAHEARVDGLTSQLSVEMVRLARQLLEAAGAHGSRDTPSVVVADEAAQ